MSTVPKTRILSWRLVVMVGLTALVLWLLWTRVADAEALFETMKTADGSMLALAAGLMALGLGLATLRLRFVLAAMGHEISFGAVFHAIMSTWPLSVVAPSRLNEFLRAVVLREHVPIVEGAGAVLAERVVDVQTLCLLAMLGSLVLGDWTLAGIAGAGLAAVWLGAVALATRPTLLLGLPLIRRKADKFARLVSAFESLRRDPLRLLGVMACSLGVWLVAVTIIFVLVGAFGAAVSYTTALALWPLAVFAGMLPLTLSGMGTRDAAFLSLLTLGGHSISDEPVLSATIAYAVITTILPGVLGLPWMIGQMDSLRRAGGDHE